MKKRSSRAIALLLAVVMVLALAACGEEPAVDPAESGEPEPFRRDARGPAEAALLSRSRENRNHLTRMHIPCITTSWPPR